MRSAMASRKFGGFPALLVVASLLMLGFSVLYWAAFKESSPTVTSPVGGLATGGVGLETLNLETPFPGAERVASMAEAQARLGFQIPLPPDITGQWQPAILWAPEPGRRGQLEQVWIVFVNGVELAVDTRSRPNIRAVVADSPDDFTLAQVGQYHAMVGAGDTLVVHGQTIEEPNSVAWWQNGTFVTLYSRSRAHSTSDLLAIAPLLVRAPVGEQQPEPQMDGGLPVPPPWAKP